MFTPKRLLNLEGLTLTLTAIAFYVYLHGSGLLFAVLLFAPDLAMLGYLINTRVGSYAYNVVHTYPTPLIMLALSLALNAETGVLIALIWLTHISMDRVVGYGLKYPTAFKDTHLQRV